MWLVSSVETATVKDVFRLPNRHVLSVVVVVREENRRRLRLRRRRRRSLPVDLQRSLNTTKPNPTSFHKPLATKAFCILFAFCKKDHFYAWKRANYWPLIEENGVLLVFIHATPFSWSQTLQRLFELTWRPSKALNLALSVALGTIWIKGHRHKRSFLKWSFSETSQQNGNELMAW